MPTAPFSKVIRQLPEADVPVPGVRGWLSQGVGHQVVFFDIEANAELPPHSHGEQWGVVVEGETEYTIGGHTRRYGPGDSYHIPAGVVHCAKFLSRFRAVEVFADADRYRPKDV